MISKGQHQWHYGIQMDSWNRNTELLFWVFDRCHGFLKNNFRNNPFKNLIIELTFLQTGLKILSFNKWRSIYLYRFLSDRKTETVGLGFYEGNEFPNIGFHLRNRYYDYRFFSWKRIVRISVSAVGNWFPEMRLPWWKLTFRNPIYKMESHLPLSFPAWHLDLG